MDTTITSNNQLKGESRPGRDRLILLLFLLGAGALLFLGRDMLPRGVEVTWGLTFGGTTAVAVLLASLYRLRLELRVSRRQLARKEAELSFAREVQRALFPRALPSESGLEFAAVCIPAAGISGDYYDVLQLQDGRLIFAIADISGKGISAAILMANLQALLRSVSSFADSPSDVCARLNHHLIQVTDDTRFATFFVGEWDAQERRLCYVNAGHHPPILMGSCRGRRLEEGGPPLGLFQDYEFAAGKVQLEPGDTLVLYSDGVTEARSASGEEFGEARLERVIEQHCGDSLPELQGAILEEIGKWSGEEAEDDMTLLIVRSAGLKEAR